MCIRDSSKHGNLKKTIVYLVTSSPTGLTGKQLGELLCLSAQSFLHHFRRCPGICREKHAGVYVYYSDDTSVFEKQVKQRTSFASQQAVVTISDPEAVLILVAIIRNHGLSAEEILALPEIKKNKIKLSAIQDFLKYHGLGKKNLHSRH